MDALDDVRTLYEHAICVSVDVAGYRFAEQVYSQAIQALEQLPATQAVVVYDGETFTSAADAISHLQLRLRRLKEIHNASL